MTNFKELNKQRRDGYRKDSGAEDFYLQMNDALHSQEVSLYRDQPIEHPFIFIYGLPRSGTTLISQVIAYLLDVGYVNNLIARFWLCPVHGIRLSRGVIGEVRPPRFESDYARTSAPSDIHEFGYFWRHWLKKYTFEDITDAQNREQHIDWNGLRLTLSNMQSEFDKPMVFKNILGSYHQQRIKELLGKVLFVYIQRDTLDVAVSILNARRKYYHDLNTWWSYVPPEFNRIKDLDYWEQIAGQVYFLKRYYDRESRRHPEANLINITYEQLCSDPRAFLEMVREKCRSAFGHAPEILDGVPGRFNHNVHSDSLEEKARFRKLLERYESEFAEEE